MVGLIPLQALPGYEYAEYAEYAVRCPSFGEDSSKVGSSLGGPPMVQYARFVDWFHGFDTAKCGSMMV